MSLPHRHQTHGHLGPVCQALRQLESNCGNVEREDALLVLEAALFNFAYSPLTLFLQMAQVLVSLEQALESGTLTTWTEEVSAAVGASAFAGTASVSAMAVVCPEQSKRWYGKDYEAFQPLIRENKDQSIVGELFGSTVVLGCAGWSIDASEVYEGPFGGSTRKPILFVSNSYDVTCPKTK